MMKRILLLLAMVWVVGDVHVAQDSRRGEYSVEVQVDARAKKWPESNTWTATVIDKRGREMYKVTKEVPYDVPFPAIQVSDASGGAIVANAFEGSMEFRDGSGKIVHTMRPFDGVDPDYERILAFSIAEDRVAILLSETDQSQAKLAFSDLKGNIIWKIQLPEKKGSEVFLSANGNYILAGSYTSEPEFEFSTVLVDREGRALHTFEYLFRFADIDEGRGMVLLTTRNGVQVSSLKTYENILKWSSNSQPQIVTDGKFIAGNIVVVVEIIEIESGVPTYVNPTLILLDTAGKVVESKSVSGSSTKPANLKGIDSRAILVNENGSVTLDAAR